MKSLKSKAVFLFSSLLIPFSAYADRATERVAKKLKQLYPATTFNKILRSEVKGIYEITMGSNIAYTDQTGRYFIFGNLFDMRLRKDLTSERRAQIRRIEFPSKFLANAIKTVRGKGQRVFAVFSDPDCPYCKKLESEFEHLDDVTIYTFLYPLESIHPGAKGRAIGVWCAKNRLQAWKQLMLKREASKLIACRNPVDKNLALGSKLGISGTPTLIAKDGRVLVGLSSAEMINQWLDQNPSSKKDSH